MRNDKATRQGEKRKAEKGTAPHGDAQWAAAGELASRFPISHLVIESLSLTAATDGDPEGRWTCAVSAAVFLFS